MNRKSRNNKASAVLRTYKHFEETLSHMTKRWGNCKQDGRLAPAYFSPEYKYFDQHLQTVKNETTV